MTVRKVLWDRIKMAAIRGMSLKNVIKIRGSFCPFDPKTATIREFLRRVNSKNMIETNAKCQIAVDVKNDKSKPFVEVTFVDKDVQVYNTENLKLMDLIAQFNLKCREKTK